MTATEQCPRCRGSRWDRDRPCGYCSGLGLVWTFEHLLDRAGLSTS